MKSLKELEQIRNETLEKVNLRKDSDAVRVVVGMATCGIAAGARDVMTSMLEGIATRKLSHITVAQTGCIGVCRLEPLVEVFTPGQEKVTYVKMTPERANRVIAEHLVNGQVVNEYTVGYYETHHE